MILGGTLADEAGLPSSTKAGLILFPLCVHSVDLIASTISVFCVRTKKGLGQELEDPLAIMKRGYYISILIAGIAFYFICYNFLYIEAYPGAYLRFYMCGLTGIAVSFLILLVTQYHTDYNF
jgi:Na+/H+-translocating membrane pyrophosphatase